MGFWPVNSDGDDLIVFKDNSRKEINTKLYFLRQQVNRKNSERPNFCLSDFIAPVSSKKDDYLGAFAVTAGKGIEKLSKKFEKNKDDYNSILVKSLGDRIAEAQEEMFHHKEIKKY